MDIIKKHIEYLKDNPEHHWFKRKLYGWGWTPATWEGWASVLVYLLIVIGLALRLDPLATAEELLEDFIAPIVVMTIMLIALSWYKGESPRWQWGFPKKGEEEK